MNIGIIFPQKDHDQQFYDCNMPIHALYIHNIYIKIGTSPVPVTMPAI